MIPIQFYALVVIYVIWQLLKRWGKMSKHETFTALMNAGMAWGAIVAVLVFFTMESYRLMVGGLFTIGFWLLSAIYFYWDYKKSHKKPASIPKISVNYTPLTPQTVEPTKPKKGKHRKRTFIKNFIFITLGIAESVYCLSLIRLWVTVTVPIGETNVPVLTYQNGFLLAFFAVGAFLAVSIAGRLRHPKEAFFDE